MEGFKAGYVNIVGKPNAGKSTLMNALIGERLSIITPKAQTTRHRIIGILNGENYQMIFSDTPGIIHEPAYKLQESMNHFIEGTFEDADVFLYIADIESQPSLDDIPDKIRNAKVPVFIILNKIDKADQNKLETRVQQWTSLMPGAEIIPVSASAKFNLEHIKSRIFAVLPVSEPYFEKDALTDRNERFFATEIIREKILLHYDKEIPYSVEVVVEEFKDEPEIVKINALIYVNRESQKGIVIGHEGKNLKKIGTDARKDLESFLGKKVFLGLQVKVMKDWRDNDRILKRFGYIQ